MTDKGQTRRFRDVRGMSGLPPTADISGHGRHFAFVPSTEVVGKPIVGMRRQRCAPKMSRRAGGGGRAPCLPPRRTPPSSGGTTPPPRSAPHRPTHSPPRTPHSCPPLGV